MATRNRTRQFIQFRTTAIRKYAGCFSPSSRCACILHVRHSHSRSPRVGIGDSPRSYTSLVARQPSPCRRMSVAHEGYLNTRKCRLQNLTALVPIAHTFALHHTDARTKGAPRVRGSTRMRSPSSLENTTLSRDSSTRYLQNGTYAFA